MLQVNVAPLVNSPPYVPLIAVKPGNEDNNTVGLDATGGHPQAAPKLDWLKPVVTANVDKAKPAITLEI